jgi:hypothetical protein
MQSLPFSWLWPCFPCWGFLGLAVHCSCHHLPPDMVFHCVYVCVPFFKGT